MIWDVLGLKIAHPAVIADATDGLDRNFRMRNDHFLGFAALHFERAKVVPLVNPFRP
jgi:hypothetical protein